MTKWWYLVREICLNEMTLRENSPINAVIERPTILLYSQLYLFHNFINTTNKPHKFYVHGSVHRWSKINNCPKRCNTKRSIYYSASSLYMFRVSTKPIIRRTQNCNYSLQYWSYSLCSYLPPTWPIWPCWKEVLLSKHLFQLLIIVTLFISQIFTLKFPTLIRNIP